MKIIAIGNRLMKDDGIAIEVAENLRERLKGYNIELLIGETDYESCFYHLKKEDFVVIIDAISIGAESGSIHMFKLEEVLSQPSDYNMQHDMNIIELIKLYNMPLKGYIIGIEAADIGIGKELSPILREKFPQICSTIENVILELITEEKNYA